VGFLQTKGLPEQTLVFEAGLGRKLVPGVALPDLLDPGTAARFAPEEWRALASTIHRRGYLDVAHLVPAGDAEHPGICRSSRG
jgi:hypothetical protein